MSVNILVSGKYFRMNPEINLNFESTNDNCPMKSIYSQILPKNHAKLFPKFIINTTTKHEIPRIYVQSPSIRDNMSKTLLFKTMN